MDCNNPSGSEKGGGELLPPFLGKLTFQKVIFSNRDPEITNEEHVQEKCANDVTQNGNGLGNHTE